jgi:hypothetical protein
MPKYTSPPSPTPSTSTLIRSTTWNTYLGSQGNLQWAYNELENISGGRFVMMKKALSGSATSGTVHQFTNYTEAYGDVDFANLITGTIQTPLHTGYVWVSACVNHTIGNFTPTGYTPNFVISIIDVSTTYNVSPTQSSAMYTAQGFTNSGGPSIGTSTSVLAPMVRALSISCIIPVSNGAKRLRIGVNRLDSGNITVGQVVVNHFTVIPLSDVSGLANFIDNVEQVIE